ncbi:MAG: LacI family DNA-binding transcriptional regulator [Candidatus Humimicrobiaceae bacterium]
MRTTIKDVAKEAKVSIATVSHVINKTRYVSSELINRVEEAINKIEYKPNVSARDLLKSKTATISVIVPDVTSRFFAEIAKTIEENLKQKGYALLIQSCNNDKERELEYLNRITSEKKVDGIIIAPLTQNMADLKQLVDSEVPYVLVDRTIEGLEANAVLSDNVDGTYRATFHLIKNGHECIGLFLWTAGITTSDERLQGYKKALVEHGLEFNQDLVLSTDENDDELNGIFKRYINMKYKPTAIICTNNKLTISLLKFLSEYGLECPKDISIIGYDDYEWGARFYPALTSVAQYPDRIGKTALDVLFEIISGVKEKPSIKRIPVVLNVRESTQIIGRGPFGEKSEYPDVLALSESEIEKVRNKNYSAAISFHYSGKAWMRLIELGIKDVFNKLGFKLLAVTDAHFDANLQCKQIDGLLLQEPDIIISIPSDEKVTAPSYQRVVKSKTKLVLINNVPNGLKHGDYVTCVSVNERENGYNAGKMLGLCFKNFEKAKIGLIIHGAPFFATKQRDFAAEQVLLEEFNNIIIVAKERFYTEDRAYYICKDMIKANPEIKGLYVSWDGPAINVMRALLDIGREDISIVTCDLDIEVAISMAKGQIIKGISSQRPYEQGVAMAYAAANAMLGKSVPPFIGVQPYSVTRSNLSKAWEDIIKEKEPDTLLEALKQKI